MTPDESRGFFMWIRYPKDVEDDPPSGFCLAVTQRKTTAKQYNQLETRKLTGKII